MNSYNLFISENNNPYIYSSIKKQILFLHPLLVNLLNPLKDNDINYPGFAEFRVSKEDSNYYLRKLKFLEKNNYIVPEKEMKFESNILASQVKNNLVKTKHIVFEVTENCNLQCAYCAYGKYYSDYDSRKRTKLDFKSAKALIDYIDNLKSENNFSRKHDRISLGFYGGEPLLNFPMIKQIIDYVNNKKQSNNSFEYSITTNGMLLDKYLDHLVENEFSLSISIDGNSHNNSFRVLPNGKDSHNILLSNIKKLRHKYPKYFEEKVQFILVKHKRNPFSDIYDFFKGFNKFPLITSIGTTGVTSKLVSEFNNVFMQMNSPKDFDSGIEDIELMNKMFLNHPKVRFIADFIKHFYGKILENYNEIVFYSDNNSLTLTPTGTCEPFGLKIFLTSQGKILPCERIGHQFGLGFIENGIVNIDNEEIAEKYNKYYNKVAKLCMNCKLVENCSECMFNKGVDSNRPTCENFKSKKDYLRLLSETLNFLELNTKLYRRIITKEM